MKTIYSSPASEPNPILVLSLEDLKYTTSFSEMEKGQTHIPMFEDKEYFFLADGKFQGFRPTKAVYGFRYQMEDGQMSKPYTAVFCTIYGKTARTLTATAYGSSGHANRASTVRLTLAVAYPTPRECEGHMLLRSSGISDTTSSECRISRFMSTAGTVRPSGLD